MPTTMRVDVCEVGVTQVIARLRRELRHAYPPGGVSRFTYATPTVSTGSWPGLRSFTGSRQRPDEKGSAWAACAGVGVARDRRSPLVGRPPEGPPWRRRRWRSVG